MTTPAHAIPGPGHARGLLELAHVVLRDHRCTGVDVRLNLLSAGRGDGGLDAERTHLGRELCNRRGLFAVGDCGQLVRRGVESDNGDGSGLLVRRLDGLQGAGDRRSARAVDRGDVRVGGEDVLCGVEPLGLVAVRLVPAIVLALVCALAALPGTSTTR